MYDLVLAGFNYNAKYFSKEHFHRIVTPERDYKFCLHLDMKDGLVIYLAE